MKFYKIAWCNKQTKQTGENRRIYTAKEKPKAVSNVKQLNKAANNKRFAYKVIEI